MEGPRRTGDTDQDLVDIVHSPLRLKYLTHDARDIVQHFGLGDMTLFYQVRLMEHCYNHGVETIFTHLMKSRGLKHKANLDGTNVRVTNVDLSAEGVTGNNLVKGISEVRMRVKPRAQASFSERGMTNLFSLDQAVVVADYSVRLDDLSIILNNVMPENLNDWMETHSRMSMPLALYQLQEYVSQINETFDDMRRNMDIKIVNHGPMTERDRQRLEEALVEIRKTTERE